MLTILKLVLILTAGTTETQKSKRSKSFLKLLMSPYFFGFHYIFRSGGSLELTMSGQSVSHTDF